MGADSLRIAPVRSRRRRRSYPIHAYIGANGGGKSLAAVYDTLPSLAAGRPIVSTVRILDPLTGEPHKLWTPLDDFRTLLSVEKCDVIMDEVTGVASSRESAGMPAAVANLLVQLRRKDITLRWTAPSWKRADTVIRETTQGVTLCMGFMGKAIKTRERYDGPHGVQHGPLLVDGQVPSAMYSCLIEGPHEHDAHRQWSSKQAFYWRTYDAATFDEWTSYRKERARPVARQLFWRPGSLAAAAYDTFDSVLSLGTVSEAGLCMDCGGNRSKPKCGCHAPAPRPRRKPLTIIPETDDTPAVGVDLPDDSDAA